MPCKNKVYIRCGFRLRRKALPAPQQAGRAFCVIRLYYSRSRNHGLTERTFSAAATATAVAAATVSGVAAKAAATAAAQQNQDDDEPSAVTVTHFGLPPFELHSILWWTAESVTGVPKNLNFLFKKIDWKRKREKREIERDSRSALNQV